MQFVMTGDRSKIDERTERLQVENAVVTNEKRVKKSKRKGTGHTCPKQKARD